MRRFQFNLLAVLAAAALLLGGCQLHDGKHQERHQARHQELHEKLDKLLHPHQYAQYLENPLYVPQCDREFIWQQLVDAMDDHFKIEQERRIRQIGDVVTQGEITTFPTSAATLLEPWRKNSVGARSRLMATLQSQRKYGVLRLIPATGGYQVAVEVHVEQEDLDRPELSTVGGASLRHNGTITRLDQTFQEASPIRLGWIDIGRDTLLEQRILANIRDRLAVAYTTHLQHLAPQAQ